MILKSMLALLGPITCLTAPYCLGTVLPAWLTVPDYVRLSLWLLLAILGAFTPVLPLRALGAPRGGWLLGAFTLLICLVPACLHMAAPSRDRVGDGMMGELWLMFVVAVYCNEGVVAAGMTAARALRRNPARSESEDKIGLTS